MTYEEREIIKIDGGRAQKQRDDVKSCFSRIKKTFSHNFRQAKMKSHGHMVTSHVSPAKLLLIYFIVFLFSHIYIFSLETNYDGEYLNLAGNAKN